MQAAGAAPTMPSGSHAHRATEMAGSDGGLGALHDAGRHVLAHAGASASVLATASLHEPLRRRASSFAGVGSTHSTSTAGRGALMPLPQVMGAAVATNTPATFAGSAAPHSFVTSALGPAVDRSHQHAAVSSAAPPALPSPTALSAVVAGKALAGRTVAFQAPVAAAVRPLQSVPPARVPHRLPSPSSAAATSNSGLVVARELRGTAMSSVEDRHQPPVAAHPGRGGSSTTVHATTHRRAGGDDTIAGTSTGVSVGAAALPSAPRRPVAACTSPAPVGGVLTGSPIGTAAGLTAAGMPLAGITIDIVPPVGFADWPSPSLAWGSSGEGVGQSPVHAARLRDKARRSYAAAPTPPHWQWVMDDVEVPAVGTGKSVKPTHQASDAGAGPVARPIDADLAVARALAAESLRRSSPARPFSPSVRVDAPGDDGYGIGEGEEEKQPDAAEGTSPGALGWDEHGGSDDGEHDGGDEMAGTAAEGRGESSDAEFASGAYRRHGSPAALVGALARGAASLRAPAAAAAAARPNQAVTSAALQVHHRAALLVPPSYGELVTLKRRPRLRTHQTDDGAVAAEVHALEATVAVVHPHAGEEGASSPVAPRRHGASPAPKR